MYFMVEWMSGGESNERGAELDTTMQDISYVKGSGEVQGEDNLEGRGSSRGLTPPKHDRPATGVW